MTLSEPQLAAYDYRGARGAIFRSALPGGLKLLALALVEFMPHCRPSVSTLSAWCGIERKTVMRGLARLEEHGVLMVQRAPGQRSRYELRAEDSWRTLIGKPITSHAEVPVPDRGTGDAAEPVPFAAVTGTKQTPEPVPPGDGTGTSGGPKAGSSRSGKQHEAARARAETSPVMGPDPTSSYQAACVMAGVTPAQAKDTWTYYATKGLPPGDYPNLEAWLVLMAKQRQTKVTTTPRSAPPRPGDDIDTTGAATAFQPHYEAVDYARAHLPGHDLNALAQKCRAVERFQKLDSASRDREFLARLKCLKATGMFFADGPLPRRKEAP